MFFFLDKFLKKLAENLINSIFIFLYKIVSTKIARQKLKN